MTATAGLNRSKKITPKAQEMPLGKLLNRSGSDSQVVVYGMQTEEHESDNHSPFSLRLMAFLPCKHLYAPKPETLAGRGTLLLLYKYAVYLVQYPHKAFRLK